MGVFNKTIIPLALVGYEMIIANSALRASLAIYHLISNAPSWNNCSIVYTCIYMILTVFMDDKKTTFNKKKDACILSSQ